jgi:4-amino-4-deoxy-L-arabinose transferase-like glycosyltransferase
VLGFVVGTSALVMSFTMAIGGANETAATTLFAVLFLFFLAMGFWNIRQRRIARHREWMIPAFGVSLGIATTRPIVGVFFAARRLSPQEFFGTAFWLGFTITLLAAETWVHYSGSQYHLKER